MTTQEFIASKEEPYQWDESWWIDQMKEYARIKCLEAIKNTRHKSCDIVLEQLGNKGLTIELNNCTREIHNIKDQDVMPEL